MGADELLEGGSLDPKKLFDEKEYITMVIDREGFSKKQNDNADLVMTLLEKELDRKEQEDIFAQLKEVNAGKILIEAIGNVKKNSDKAKLCAACWESGLDFTDHFIFFTELTCQDDFILSMEALTVIENIEGALEEKTLTKALEIAQNCKSKNTHLINDLIENIKQRIN